MIIDDVRAVEKIWYKIDVKIAHPVSNVVTLDSLKFFKSKFFKFF